MRALAFLPILLASACSSTQWVRPDVTVEQADMDQVDCQRRAANEASLRAGGYYGRGYPSRSLGRAAMDRGGFRMLDEAQLTDFCMRVKGYQRQATN